MKGKDFLDILKNTERKVGETVNVNGIVHEVITDEDFAFEVIRELSSMKHLYNLDIVILYVANKGIIPENLSNCLQEIKKACIQLGWNLNITVKEELNA